MEFDGKRLLTILFSPFGRSKPQFFSGQVECIPNQRKRLRAGRQLLGSSSLGQSEHGEGCNSSSERYDEKIDRHGRMWGVRLGGDKDKLYKSAVLQSMREKFHG